MEPTRKFAEEQWIFITTTEKLHNNRIEFEHTLATFYKRTTLVNIKHNTGYKRGQIVQHNFLFYAAVLSQEFVTSSSPTASTFPLNLYKYPVTINFTYTNNNSTYNNP